MSKHEIRLQLSYFRLTGLKSRKELELQQKQEALNKLRQDLAEIEAMYVEWKAKARRLLNEAKELGEIMDDLQELFADLPEELEEIDAMIIAEHTRADLNVETDPEVIRQYQHRKNQISEKRTLFEARTDELNATRADLGAIRTVWEPTFTQLVEQISARYSMEFSKIGCAGEVQIIRDDDYHKWGLQLLVKFRDHEALAPLTCHRQSGGEKSVSIILYLLSLQHFSKAPFRVVDEINQGMDPRNERAIHSQLVNTVCGSTGGSQYFLITPKLLPDLLYHENMRVLTIYNSSFVPERWDACAV